jgi:uncharacterized protein with FMN-binding domain
MKKGLKALLIVGGIAAAIWIGASIAIRAIERTMNELLETAIPTVELLDVPDGTYEGVCDAVAVKVVVRVVVASGRIDQIILVEHRNGQGASGEAVLDQVLLAQSLEVDAVAGATYSSKAILLAIADALTTLRRAQ